MEDCIPQVFEWKDPSKIQIEEVFHLLDHWRACQNRGLDPLIWASTCPLFKDSENITKNVQATRQVRALRPSDSEEEIFSLPDSDEIDSEGNGSNNNHSQEPTQHYDASADEQALFMDTPRDDVEMDHPDNNMSGKSCPDHVRFNSIVLTVLHSTIRGHGERYPYPIQ